MFVLREQGNSVSTALLLHTCPTYFQTHLAANPSPIISTMASKKRKVDSEGRHFQEKWELQYFFTENRGNCVCLICQEAVALFKEFNVKRHYQTKHANAYLCEQTFSVMNLNKNRLRSKLSDSHLHDILRISTSAVKPDLAYLLKSRSQYHPSH